MVRISIPLSETAHTTRLAQQAVDGMVGRVPAVFKEAGVEDKDIAAAWLTFSPGYEWLNHRNVLIGQHAEQRMELSAADAATVLPAGQMETTTRVSAVFVLEQA